MPDKFDAQRPDSASNFSLLDFLAQSIAIAVVEFKKLIRDPTELFSRAVQPILWLVIFGQVFGKVQGIPTGNICIVKTRERFMGIGQLLTMPLFFASNAIYPLTLMPPWLRLIAKINPLTYLVDALRGFMIEGGHSFYGFGRDFVIMMVSFVILIIVA